jgi:hypothetical protein
MNGLIVAASAATTSVRTVVKHFQRAGITDTRVIVGDGPLECSPATVMRNPFYHRHGVLSSLWLAEPFLRGEPFLLVFGQSGLSYDRLSTFLQTRPQADIAVDFDGMARCSDEGSGRFFDALKHHIWKHGYPSSLTQLWGAVA